MVQTIKEQNQFSDCRGRVVLPLDFSGNVIFATCNREEKFVRVVRNIGAGGETFWQRRRLTERKRVGININIFLIYFFEQHA